MKQEISLRFRDALNTIHVYLNGGFRDIHQSVQQIAKHCFKAANDRSFVITNSPFITMVPHDAAGMYLV
jgi:hypothetical protein